MALTRKSLKAMGLTVEQVDSIVEMHSETVDGLKEKLKAAEEKADKFDDVQRELDTLKSKNGEDYKKKYEDEKKAFSDYKAQVESEKEEVVKKSAVKAYFEKHGITGANLEIALRGASEEIKSVKMKGEEIEDTAELDELIGGTFKGLVVTEGAQGANVPKPISNNSKPQVLSRQEIYKKDEHGKYVYDTAERQKLLAQNLNEERNK